jgi:hypothetical protein
LVTGPTACGPLFFGSVLKPTNLCKPTLGLSLNEVPIVSLELIYTCGFAFPIIGVPRLSGFDSVNNCIYKLESIQNENITQTKEKLNRYHVLPVPYTVLPAPKKDSILGKSRCKTTLYVMGCK